ncbi:MAG TPA: DUF4382 domain-containing protein [Terriglobales bacterium]|jgi:hypothetical protein
MKKTTLLSLATATAIAFSLAACGGSSPSSTSTTQQTPTSGAAGTPPPSTAVVTAGDAPMANVLAVQVTLSSVTATNANSTVTNLISSPITIELAHLGDTRSVLATAPLPQGTYNGMSATVSAVKVTYLDSTNTVQTADSTLKTPTATIASGTVSTTFKTPVTVNWQNASDVAMDFNLASSLDLSATTGVTFTPAVTFSMAQASAETAAARMVSLNGTVTATNTVNNTVSLTLDSGFKTTLNITSTTAFDNGNSLALLKTGAKVRSDASIDAAGTTLTATTLESVDNGTAESATTNLGTTTAPNVVSSGRVDAGIVTAVTGSPATAFTMVVQSSSAAKAVGTTINVTVGTANVFEAAQKAAQYGDAVAFNGTQIFVGQSVVVAGTFDPTATNGPITSTQVQLQASSGVFATTGAVTQTLGGTAGTTVLTNVFPTSVVSLGAVPVGTAVSVSAQTCALSTGKPPCTATAMSGAANADGGIDIDAKHILTLATATKINARGYLSQGGGTATLSASSIFDPTGVAPKSN